MSDRTVKNLFDDGYTTYHEDGSKSVTYKNLFDDGYTTYHEDGGKSKTYSNILSDGYTTYHEDGSKSKTYSNILSDGYTTYHEDGSKSKTYSNILSDGYTTYHDRPNRPKTDELTASSAAGFSSGRTLSGGYSTSYIYSRTIDLPHIILAGIGILIALGLDLVYSKEYAWLPVILFAGSFATCFICSYRKIGRPYIWAWLYSISATALVMIMVNTRQFHAATLFGLIVYLTPVAVAFIFGFISAFLEYEDRFSCNIPAYVLMAVAWFCCIYKDNYYSIYKYCLVGEVIAFLAFALISLLLTIREAKKQERLR